MVAYIIDLLCHEGGLKLVNGSRDGEGRVEICLNEIWGTVCSNNWDHIDSTVHGMQATRIL